MLSNCSFEIKRLVYENWVARNKQTVASYLGYLTAVSENSNLMQDSKFWKLYKLSIQSIIDIKETDTIVINNEEYSVKWVAKRNGWSLNLTTVILQQWV